MADKSRYNPEEPTINYLTAKGMEYEADLKMKKLESGWLGTVFGTRNAPANIAGFVVVAVLFAGLLSFFRDADTIIRTWTIIAPIITGAMGFLFGKKV